MPPPAPRCPCPPPVLLFESLPHAVREQLVQQQLEVELRVGVGRVEPDRRLEVGHRLVDRGRSDRAAAGRIGEGEDPEQVVGGRRDDVVVAAAERGQLRLELTAGARLGEPVVVAAARRLHRREALLRRPQPERVVEPEEAAGGVPRQRRVRVPRRRRRCAARTRGRRCARRCAIRGRRSRAARARPPPRGARARRGRTRFTPRSSGGAPPRARGRRGAARWRRSPR